MHKYFCMWLYKDRSKVLINSAEEELWKCLDYNYMTDESEHEADDGEAMVYQHSLPWRSQSKHLYANIIYFFRTQQTDTD